jgi:hypothetical protein
MTGKKIVTDWLESRHCCFYGRHEVVGEPCLADAIDTALTAEREACCRDMCKLCLRGNLATHTTGDKYWIHFVNDGLQAKGTNGGVVVCGASSIRLRRM